MSSGASALLGHFKTENEPCVANREAVYWERRETPDIFYCLLTAKR